MAKFSALFAAFLAISTGVAAQDGTCKPTNGGNLACGHELIDSKCTDDASLVFTTYAPWNDMKNDVIYRIKDGAPTSGFSLCVPGNCKNGACIDPFTED